MSILFPIEFFKSPQEQSDPKVARGSGTTMKVLQELRQGKVIEMRPDNTLVVDEMTPDGMKRRKGVKPLLRGIIDQPEPGATVILLDWEDPEVTEKQDIYYMGPLNTENQATKNRMISRYDHYSNISYQVHTGRGGLTGGMKLQKKFNDSGADTEDEDLGWRRDFPKAIFGHLTKVADFVLDFPKEKWNKLKVRRHEHTKPVVGDMFIEGRFGNSIRLGNRHNRPHLIISNGRPPGTSVESFNDSSVMLLTQTGPLKHHLGLFDSQVEPHSFVSAVEGTENVKRVNLDKDYEKAQIFIQSDRIIFNTKKDNFYVSTASTIDLNAVQDINFSTPKNIVIDSTNIYLGREAVEPDEARREPVAMGDSVEKALEGILDLIENLMFIEYGPQGGLVSGPTGMPVPLKGNPKINNIRTLLKNIKSDSVFVRKAATNEQQQVT